MLTQHQLVEVHEAIVELVLEVRDFLAGFPFGLGAGQCCQHVSALTSDQSVLGSRNRRPGSDPRAVFAKCRTRGTGRWVTETIHQFDEVLLELLHRFGAHVGDNIVMRLFFLQSDQQSDN